MRAYFDRAARESGNRAGYSVTGSMEAKRLNVAPLFGGDGIDGSEASAAAAVGELHAAGDLGEEGVVGADAHIGAGLDAGAALTHDDGTASDQLTGKCLHAEPLCVRVASVCGAA